MKQLLYQLQNLKDALLSLPATGETGFEGLIGVTLHEISGVPFRLAGSGSQFGIDGKPVYEGDAISFEGKRYDGQVPRTEVLSKIAELSINESGTDIWVLGATSQVKSQLADDVRSLGTKNGIFVLLLDWSKTGLSPFAVALTIGGTRVEEFLTSYVSDKKMLRKALVALEAVRNSQDFASHAERIVAQCNEPAVGWILAQKANTDWLTDAFFSRKRAKMKLGQPLSPADTDTPNVLQRMSLIDELHQYFTAIADETVVCILGGEGCGKSWIVAQSWLALPNKPLMVFMSPDDFEETAGRNDVVDLLISKLIKQTGDEITGTRARWRRRLGQWRGRSATDSPTLIVVIDGINQRPRSDWARIIEGIDDELYQLGGRLIVTTRTPYFRDRVQGRLTVPFTEVIVPEWTGTERDEILSEHGIRASDLHQSVAVSLLNPRLLGIALELLGKAEITNFNELSVSRLLFEHMRMSERDAPEPQPAHEFAGRLQDHARQIMSRVKGKQKEDLNIFEDDIGAVADGRFYQAVESDPTRYCLKDEGLTLALGFSVIDRLRTAKRNGRDLDAELYALLEPVAALDDTADVILAALTVTALDERYDQDDIVASVVKGFAELQNPDQAKFFSFASLAKNQTKGFLGAARTLALAGGHQPNYDWIRDALIEAGKNSHAWQKMVENVHSWLSVYSLAPERRAILNPTHEEQKKVREEREKNREIIGEKLQALSEYERATLEKLQEEEGDLSVLSRLALLLLAGKSLEPFAPSLLNWSFSYALNSDHAAPYEDFMHLVSLNRIDWRETRVALLEQSMALREKEVSTTGQWALVYILYATGHSDDGMEARVLAEDLTKDRHPFEGWRLIETYCATDPCDPSSEEPENVLQTAEKYEEIDVSKLRQSMYQAEEDLFFEMARAGLARFKPEVMVAKHREFAADVLSRSGFPLRQGLLELREHNSLLTFEDARELVKKWHEAKNAGNKDSLSEQDAWLASQYMLLLAFPFLSAKEQFEILLSDDADEKILLKLMELTKPISEVEFENLLGEAIDKDSERNQHLLLGLSIYTGLRLTEVARTYVAALFRSESELVRTQALRVIAQSGDKQLLAQVADSDWNAADAETDNNLEYWYGSDALLQAAVRGLIAHHEALDRISASLYGRAARMLDVNAASDIAHRIDAAINQAAGLDGDLVVPDIEIRVHLSTPYEPSMFSVGERQSEARDVEEVMKRLSENSDDFDQRQKRSYEAFVVFEFNLTEAKARIILDNIRLEEFTKVLSIAEDFGNRWHGLFMSIAEQKLPAVHNLVLLLAHALASKAPAKSEELFRRVKNSKPLVRFTFGMAGVPLDAMAVWAGDRNHVLDDLRFARLDRAGNDHDLSLEVLAALMNDKQEMITCYIETKLSKEEPAEISRGIMVAGFSDQSKYNDDILMRYEGSAGLMGEAQKAAKYAYVRNVWAQHWFEKMCLTDENTDFWRYSVLFSKIVDGRFAVWRSNYTQKGSSIRSFGPSLNSKLKNRIANWESHRNDKLFGSDAPTPIFLAELGTNGLDLTHS
ncbi:MAG: hypothetical protein ACYC0L_00710 [Thermoleophilia bacterium]